MRLSLASLTFAVFCAAATAAAQPTFSPEVNLPAPKATTAGGLTATLVSLGGTALVVRADNGTLVPFVLDNDSTVPAGLVQGTRVTVRYEPVEGIGYRVDTVGIPRIPSDPDASTEPPPEVPPPATVLTTAPPSPAAPEATPAPAPPAAGRVSDARGLRPVARRLDRRPDTPVRALPVAATSEGARPVPLEAIPLRGTASTDTAPMSEAATDDVLALLAIGGFLLVSGGLGVIAFKTS
jgi:hypothetical protein